MSKMLNIDRLACSEFSIDLLSREQIVIAYSRRVEHVRLGATPRPPGSDTLSLLSMRPCLLRYACQRSLL
jgi:hypothetical protein